MTALDAVSPAVRDRLRLRRVVRPDVRGGGLRVQTDGRPIRELLAIFEEPEVAALPIVAFVADKTLNAKTVDELADSPHLARFRSIRLVGVKLGDEGFATLVRSPRAAGLKELSLCGSGIGAAGFAALDGTAIALEALSLEERAADDLLRALLLTPGASALRSLDVRSKLAPQTIRALAESPALEALASLQLDDAGVTNAAVAPLSSASFARLAKLGLSRNPIAAAVFATLDAAPFAPSLRALGLRGTRIDDAGLAKLASATKLGLTSLDLHRSEVHGPGLAAIAGAPHLAGLVTLALGGSRSVHAKGDVAAGAVGSWKGLRELTLDHAHLSDAGAASIAACEGLRVLRLAGNGITAKGAASLGAAAFAAHLEELDLEGYPGDPKIGPDGAVALAQPGFESLRHLVLKNQEIGDAGLRAVASAFPRLEKLDLERCLLSADGVDALASARFHASLVDLDLSFNEVGPHAGKLGAALPRLARLDLADTKATDAAMVEMLTAASDALEHIDLGGCKELGDATVEALIARAGQLVDVAGGFGKASADTKAELVAALKPPKPAKAKVRAKTGGG